MPTNVHYTYVDKFENLIYVAGRIESFDSEGTPLGRSPYLGVYNTEDGSYSELTTDLDQSDDFSTIHGMSIFNGKMYIIYGANGDDNGGQFPEWKILSTDIN